MLFSIVPDYTWLNTNNKQLWYGTCSNQSIIFGNVVYRFPFYTVFKAMYFFTSVCFVIKHDNKFLYRFVLYHNCYATKLIVVFIGNLERLNRQINCRMGINKSSHIKRNQIAFVFTSGYWNGRYLYRRYHRRRNPNISKFILLIPDYLLLDYSKYFSYINSSASKFSKQQRKQFIDRNMNDFKTQEYK